MIVGVVATEKTERVSRGRSRERKERVWIKMGWGDGGGGGDGETGDRWVGAGKVVQ